MLRNIVENLNCLSRAHERYRQTTDGRAIAYSKREREFTFAKKYEKYYIFKVVLNTDSNRNSYM